MYSPRMPIDSSCMPVENASPATSVAQPGTGYPMTKSSTTIQIAKTSAASAVKPPSALHSRSGRVVKAVMPVKASCDSRRSENVLRPAWRGAGM